MKARLRSLLWGLLVVAIVIVFFGPTVFRNHSLVPTDMLHQLIFPYSANTDHIRVQNHYTMDALTIDYPWGVFWQQSVRAGELPLWNPHILGGHPHQAESMPAVFSPFKLFYLFTTAERAFSLGIVLEFILAGLFMFAFLREIGRSDAAAFIGSCAYALNSSLLLWYWRAPNVFCWAPLILLLWERAVSRSSTRQAAGAGFVLGVAYLSGNIQAAAHLTFLCGGYALLCSSPPLPQRAGKLILMLGIALTLAAVQFLPTLELLTQDAFGSTRVRGPAASLRHTLLGIPALITFVFPAITGSTESFDLLKAVGASRGDFAGYIGLLPFTLCLIGALVVADRRVRGLRLIIVAVLVLLFLTPFVRFLYHRFFIVMVFAMAVIAAFGTDTILTHPAPDRARITKLFRVMGWGGGLILLAVLGVQLALTWNWSTWLPAAKRYILLHSSRTSFSFRPDWLEERVELLFAHYRVTNFEFWLPVLCLAIGFGLWFVYSRGNMRRSWFVAGLVVFSVLDLIALGRPLVPQVDLQKYPLRIEHPTLTPVQNDPDLFRVWRWSPNAPFIYRPSLLLPARVNDISGNFSLAPENVQSLEKLIQTPSGFSPVLNLLNVKYFYSDQTNALPADQFPLIVESNGLRLYRNEQALPRFFFVTHAEVIPSHPAVSARLIQSDFNPRTTVVLEESPPPLSGGGTQAEIQVSQYRGGRVDLAVTTTSAGLLVISDTYYPGWKAWVDGKPTKIFRANSALRAIYLPAGQHLVKLRFVPVTFLVGAAVSVLTFGLALVWMRASPRQKPSRSNPPASDTANTTPRSPAC
ncbi:MAG: hypothetical protein PCFJNLEI_00716 [Verrucomicrobiae bacterium]|nr:hypothetical protein [Verrucomicrobiae bacterium]